MFTRRLFALAGVTFLAYPLARTALAQADEVFEVRIRADETVRGALPPIALRELSVTVDRSQSAQALASRSPPQRAAPVFLIIAGALAATQIVRLIKEMVREFYYGGVVIDGRKSPPEITNDPKIPADMVFVFLSGGKLQQFKSGEIPLQVIISALGHKG